ncbi:glyoxalase/bleomycin resistance protein/dioxygenase superfamily protein [Flavobacterium sp. 90]|uniref:VOC family protein n=1 Tax=unclassified Flavobacterium TaxID=196869 RepID=UPI000EAE8AFD|nr:MULTISPECIES: VOC family protein [unclassified Flavobacterium]RKR05381.1 glyoxalase/bleomycin resistance protein/dioxygenase superfamily protein [Flavobacterium sp. 81]TCK56696.1 glyoxalase/bleomycin resistance protein/dioxygenase superfamily protein [Flavobacterium sp. 90]
MFLRVARHTDDLERIVNFYVDILGFELLGDFQNHNNYDGVFVGKSGLDWHFEFTKSHEKANHTFDQDDVIVLYPKSIIDYDVLISQLLHNNISIITASNPFWNENGKMFLDPDGYRIVVSPLKAIINEIN